VAAPVVDRGAHRTAGTPAASTTCWRCRRGEPVRRPTTRRVAVLATSPAGLDLALLALRLPSIDVVATGALGIDAAPAGVDLTVAVVDGTGEAWRAPLEAEAALRPVIVVADDPTWARTTAATFAAVVPTARPAVLADLVRLQLGTRRDTTGPTVPCLCGRRILVLQAAFDVRTHQALLHCEHCGWVTDLELRSPAHH
jgi:hypothetical protein